MEFVIGQPKRTTNLTNKYKLVIEYMHGDADAFDSNTYTFTNVVKHNEPTLKDVIKMIQVSVQYGEFFDSSAVRKTALTAAGFSEETIDNLCDYWEADVTTDGNSLAVIENFELTYFDELGVEHEVQIIE